ncbi:MAG: radical SAM/SPASM domain-containing protein [Nanoarchaeota archaeon]
MKSKKLKEFIDSSKLAEKLKKFFGYDSIILGVNHACPLMCEKCYLNYPFSFQTNEISLEDYERIIKQAKELNVSEFRIAEKEPFSTPQRLFDIINLIKKVYGKQKHEIVMVTNGILAKENFESTKRNKIFFDYLCFSIDGFDETDKILRKRSKEIYEKISVREILETAKQYKKISSKLCINSVLTNKNYKELPEFIEWAHKIAPEIDLFSIDIFNEVPEKNNSHLKCSIMEFDEFIKKIEEKANNKKIRIDLVIYANKKMKEYLKWLYENKYIKENADMTKNLFFVSQRGYFRIFYQLFPIEGIKDLRISSDGYVMGLANELMSGNYRQEAVGNIKEESLKELWSKFREKNLKKLIAEYLN